MSLKSLANKAGSAVKGAAKNAIKGAFSNSYRTSVLNDFSTVEKATLTFGKIAKNGEPEIKPAIKVQINPYEIRFENTASTIHNYSAINGETNSELLPTTNNQKGNLNFSLHYDFYDEYYARNSNGSGYGLSTIAKLATSDSFHLKNNELSSLESIIDYSKDPDYFVYFKWGVMKAFGHLSMVSPTYTAFSPWGEPLKAHVDITISVLDETKIENGSKLYSSLTEEVGKFKAGNALKKAGSMIKSLR